MEIFFTKCIFQAFVFINNIERIRESLKSLQYELEITNTKSENTKSNKDKSADTIQRPTIDPTIPSSTNSSLINLINQLIDSIVKYQVIKIKIKKTKKFEMLNFQFFNRYNHKLNLICFIFLNRLKLQLLKRYLKFYTLNLDLNSKMFVF